MRLALALGLFVPGLMLLASALPLGLLLMIAGWWFYERSTIADDDLIPAVLITLGGGYAAWLLLAGVFGLVRTLL